MDTRMLNFHISKYKKKYNQPSEYIPGNYSAPPSETITAFVTRVKEKIMSKYCRL